MDTNALTIFNHLIREYSEVDLYKSDNWIPIISLVIFSWLLFTVLGKRYIVYSENGNLPPMNKDFWVFMTIIKQILMLGALVMMIFFYRHDFQGFINKLLGTEG